MAASSGRINFKVKAFVDRQGVRNKINKWKLGQLSRVGAYARGAMKKQIRPPLRGRRGDRTVTLNVQPGDLPPTWKGPRPHQITCFVPTRGPVIDVRTGRPVTRQLAIRAAIQVHSIVAPKGSGEGKPPRRGPTDKLRRHIYFSVDVAKESVVIGPEPFPSQPVMVGRVSVPELLNKGGIEVIFGQRVKYGPRPYVETILKPALAKLRENIRKKPISNRI
jgi:hypothetical protein